MRILFDHATPFFLAHGGLQVQIEQTKAALQQLGVEVEPVRWWDESQKGDLIHYFGRPGGWYVQLAQQKGFKVVFSDLLGAVGARPRLGLAVQEVIMRCANRFAPRNFLYRLGWESYQRADAILALTAWEAQIMQSLYGTPRERLHIVPNGVDDVFFEKMPVTRGPWLVCTSTINAVKRVVELAQMAILAQTPVWIIGKPYSDSDPVAKKFFSLAKAHPDTLRYSGPIYDRRELAKAYREARGFVLLSQWESLSISALEAAACECPLFLADKPWAHCVFGDKASYCPPGSPGATAKYLQRFYAQAPTLPLPPKPKTWREIAQDLKAIYENVAGGQKRPQPAN